MKRTVRAATVRGQAGPKRAVRSSLVVATCAIAMAIVAPLAAVRAPVIAIHLVDYAGTPYRDLAEAQHVVADIFGGIGVNTVWREESSPAALTEPTGVSVLVLSPEMSKQKCVKEQIDEHVLGIAAPHPAKRAWVFFDRIADAASVQGRSTGWMLGHVIAHEVVHLLGELGHVERGLMERTVDQSGHFREGLTREQGDRIYATLRRAERGAPAMSRVR